MMWMILAKATLQPVRLAKCPERGLKLHPEMYMQKKMETTSPIL